MPSTTSGHDARAPVVDPRHRARKDVLDAAHGVGRADDDSLAERHRLARWPRAAPRRTRSAPRRARIVPSPMSCAGSAFDGRAQLAGLGHLEVARHELHERQELHLLRGRQGLARASRGGLQLPEANEEPELVDHRFISMGSGTHAPRATEGDQKAGDGPRGYPDRCVESVDRSCRRWFERSSPGTWIRTWLQTRATHVTSAAGVPSVPGALSLSNTREPAIRFIATRRTGASGPAGSAGRDRAAMRLVVRASCR